MAEEGTGRLAPRPQQDQVSVMLSSLQCSRLQCLAIMGHTLAAAHSGQWEEEFKWPWNLSDNKRILWAVFSSGPGNHIALRHGGGMASLLYSWILS